MTFKIVLTKEERKARAEKARKQAIAMLQNDTPTAEISPNNLAKKLQQFSAATQIPIMAEIAEEKLANCLAVVDEFEAEGKGSITLSYALLALADYYDPEQTEGTSNGMLTHEQLQAILRD